MRKWIRKINIEKTAIWFSLLLLIFGIGFGFSGWFMFPILGLLLAFFCLLKRFYLLDIFAILLMFVRQAEFMAEELALIPTIKYFLLIITIVICSLIIANFFVILHKVKMAKIALNRKESEKQLDEQ